MSVEGIDACWLGPADLANSLGHARNTPEHDVAVNEMIAACKRHGKAAGIAAGSVEQVEKWVAAGCTFVSAGGDKIYVGSSAAAEFNALASPEGVERHGAHRLVDQSRQGETAPRRGGPRRGEHARQSEHRGAARAAGVRLGADRQPARYVGTGIHVGGVHGGAGRRRGADSAGAQQRVHGHRASARRGLHGDRRSDGGFAGGSRAGGPRLPLSARGRAVARRVGGDRAVAGTT